MICSVSLSKPGKLYSSGDLAEVVSWNLRALWMSRSQWSYLARQVSLLVQSALSRESGLARRSTLDAYHHPLKLLSRERDTNNVNWKWQVKAWFIFNNIGCSLLVLALAILEDDGRRDRETRQCKGLMMTLSPFDWLLNLLILGYLFIELVDTRWRLLWSGTCAR